MIPGEIFLDDGEILANTGRSITKIVVANTGDRPIQVGSHFHFFEVNKALQFNRVDAFGMRLNIPAGTAVRFEPGEEKEVSLVAFAGTRNVFGLNSLTDGHLDEDTSRGHALSRATGQGFIRLEEKHGS